MSWRQHPMDLRARTASAQMTESVTFQQMVWGNDDTTASAPPSFSSSVALEAATAFFRTWTLSNREALSFLDRVYPEQLLYFGKRSSKAYVMADKQAFVERWPQRAYSMRPGTVSTSCDPKDNSCTVSGVIDWRASLERQD